MLNLIHTCTSTQFKSYLHNR